MSTTQSEPFAPRDWALLATTALIWGSSFLFMRVAVADMQPGLVAFLRVLLGVATLAAFPAARTSVPWSAWPRIAAVGFTWMALPFLLFSLALQWIDSSLAGMLNASVPLFTALIAAGVTRRLPGWRQQAGLLVGLLGVVVVSMPSVVGAKATALGVALVLIASVSYGVAGNVTAPLQKLYGPLPVIMRAELVAVFLLLPFGVQGLGGSTISVKGAAALIALGALGTGVAFATFVTLLNRVGLTRAPVTVYFMPIVAMVVGWLVLREPIGPTAIAGTLLILGGAWLVSRKETPVATTTPTLTKAAGLAGLLLVASRVDAQQPLPTVVTVAPARDAVWPLPRLTGSIRIDGVSDDLAWRSIPPLPMAVYLPVPGSASSERTEARIAYDADAIYVSIDAWEAHPGGIRASSMVRDDDAPGDFVNVMIDPFGDRKNSVGFSTTPAGQRVDWTVVNDAQTPGFNNAAWNGVWELATRRDATGYHVEMRIPFSTLRFSTEAGRTEFGLSVNRLTSHSNERVVFPAIEPSSGTALWKPSLMQRVSVENISAARSIRVTPYAVAGLEGLRAPDVTSSPWRTSDRTDAGGDLKMALTPYLTLDLTANTDFAEAEADDQRVNLTRFPILFPERRQFFVEQAGTFEVRTGERDLLFHSRRVGLTEAGDVVRLLGGARLAGRIGGWDVGMFDAQTAADAGAAASNVGVLRARHTLRDPRSWVGIMTTTRLASDSEQVAVGVDGELRLAPDDFVTFAAAALAGHAGVGADSGVLPRGALRFVAERRRNLGGWYRVGIATTGARYAPALGYVERADAIRPVADIGYGRIVSKAGHILRGGANTALLYRNAEGRFDAAATSVALELESVDGVARLSVAQQDDDVPAGFNPTPTTTVPAARYTARSVRFDFTPPPGPSMVVGVSLRAGEFYDGSLVSALISPEWRASAYLRVSGDLQLDRVSFPSRAEREWSRLGRLRVLTSASTRLSLATTIQATSVGKFAQANTRLRYNAAEGHDLWVVYGHLENLNRDRVTPELPGTARSTFLVKYTRSYGR